MEQPFFTGACTALVTPFLNGQVNYPMMERLLQRQIDAYTAVIPLERTAWMRPLLQELDFLLEGAAHYAARTYEMAQVAGLEPYHDVLKQEWLRL